MNQYRKCVERIHVSESLNARVMETVRATRNSRKKTYDRYFRIAAGAACALALVLGTISLRGTVIKPVLEYPGSTTEEPFKPLLDYAFGITAGAVEHAVNGGLIFRWEDGHGSFRISGEHIREVYLETSRGILLKGEERLGTSIREPFSAHTVYGLAAPEGEEITDIGQVELLLEVAFEDGTVKEERYTLRAEKLRAFFNEDGKEVLVPALVGDDAAHIPALYMDAEEGQWLYWPVAEGRMVRLSMSYGLKKQMVGSNGSQDLFHAGIDIPGKNGLSISASEHGTVLEAGYDSSRGNYLVLDHGDGLTTVYAHCQEILVKQGDTVTKGQEIAWMGSTGMATGPHLHFEVRQNGEAQNPIAFFKGDVRDTLYAQ